MKPVFNIGKARHRILLQQLSTTSDGSGGSTGTWVDLITGDTEEDRKIFAIVEPMQGRRGLEYQQTVNYYPYSVIIRLNRSLSYNAKYRFLLDGKIYVIHSIINKNERDFIYEVVAYTKEQEGESQPPLTEIDIQINGISSATATESPFNICLVNTNGNEVGTVGSPTLDFSNLEVDLEVDL